MNSSLFKARPFLASSPSLMTHLLPCRQFLFARGFSNFNPPEYYNQKQATKVKVHDAILRYQKHKSDTGSPSAQIAGATEKILNLVRHFAIHKKDNASWRGYQMLVSRRRRMLEYLKRTDVKEYNRIVQELGLATKRQVKAAQQTNKDKKGMNIKQ